MTFKDSKASATLQQYREIKKYEEALEEYKKAEERESIGTYL
jgi:hypothetical protein